MGVDRATTMARPDRKARNDGAGPVVARLRQTATKTAGMNRPGHRKRAKETAFKASPFCTVKAVLHTPHRHPSAISAPNANFKTFWRSTWLKKS